MKRTTFCLLAGGLLTFAACQQESTTGMTQLQIDSAVNARVDSIRGDMMMRNDSMINALAMQKADSMLMARGSGAAGTTAGKTTKPATGSTTKPTTPPPPTVGNGKPSMTNNPSGTVGQGKPDMKNNKENEKNNTIGNGKPKM